MSCRSLVIERRGRIRALIIDDTGFPKKGKHAGVSLHPKHAAWLNMTEIEIGVLRGPCLDRRIGERETLSAQVNAQRQRNHADAQVK